MKTSIFAPGKLWLLGAALGCASLTGCFSDSGNNSSGGNTASIRGDVQGDVEQTSSGSGSTSDDWSGTVVTSYVLNADGSMSAAEDSTTTDAQGHFTLTVNAQNTGERIVKARRGTTEWMTHVQGNLQADQTANSRPLNLESTLEAAVYLETRKTSEGRQVSSSEVNLAVDASVAASATGAYRGTQASRDSLVARLSYSIQQANKAREAYFAAADSAWAAHRADADSARVRAEADFNASLYAAGRDTGSARQAERAYLNAVVNAYLSAHVDRTSHARAAEASYQAFVRASAQVSDSARTRVARSYARVVAVASDTAMRSNFNTAGGSSSRVNLVVQAGTKFRSSVDTANSRDALDSAMARFRTQVRAAFSDSSASSDTGSFHLFANVFAALNITTLINTTNATLQTSLTAAGTRGDSVGQAFANAHLAARATMQSSVASQNGGNQGEARAAADLMAFLSVKSNSSH